MNLPLILTRDIPQGAPVINEDDTIVVVRGNSKTERISAKALQNLYVKATATAPTTATSPGEEFNIAWDGTGVYTYKNGIWGKSPRSTSNWSDFTDNTRLFVLDHPMELGVEELQNARETLGIVSATTEQEGLVRITSDVTANDGGVVTGAQMVEYVTAGTQQNLDRITELTTSAALSANQAAASAASVKADAVMAAKAINDAEDIAEQVGYDQALIAKGYAEDAAVQVTLAADQVDLAEAQVTLAAGQVTLATTQANKAANSATAAATSASNAASTLSSAAKLTANNTYTGTNTFNGAVALNGAVTAASEPATNNAPLRRAERDLLSFLSEINKGELTPEFTLASETGSITNAKNGVRCPADGTITSAYLRSRFMDIFAAYGNYKSWNIIYLPFTLNYATMANGAGIAVRLLMGDSLGSLAANSVNSFAEPCWDFRAADGISYMRHWHYAEIFITKNESNSAGKIIMRTPIYHDATTRQISGMAEWVSTVPTGTYPYLPNGSSNGQGGKGILIVRTSDYRASVYYAVDIASATYKKIGEMVFGSGSVFPCGTTGSFNVYLAGQQPSSASAAMSVSMPKVTVQLGAPIPAADALLAATPFTGYTKEELTTAQLEEKYPIES